MTTPNRGTVDSPPPAAGDTGDDAEVIRRSRHEPEQFAALFRRHAREIQRYGAGSHVRLSAKAGAVRRRL